MSWRTSTQGSDRGCSRENSLDSRLSGSARSGASKAEQDELRREKAELQDQIEHMQEQLDTVRKQLDAVKKEQLVDGSNSRRRYSKKRRGDGSSSSDDEKRKRTSKSLHAVVKDAVSKQRQRAKEELDLAKQKASMCIEEMDELQNELRVARQEQEKKEKLISELHRHRLQCQLEVQAAQEGMQTEVRVSARLQDELQEFRKIREESSRRHPDPFDPGFSQHAGFHPPPDNTDANSLAAELVDFCDIDHDVLDGPYDEIVHTRSGETVTLVKQLKAELDEALKGKQAAEAEASAARAEAVEKDEELRKSLAESTTPWGQGLISRRPSIAESIASTSTCFSSSDGSSRSTRESVGSESGRITRRDRRARTERTMGTYNVYRPGMLTPQVDATGVKKAMSLTSNDLEVPADPVELKESYLRLLEEAERLRAERDEAQKERQELSSEQNELEEAVEESRRWKVWDSLTQAGQQVADMALIKAAGTMNLEPIREDEPSGPQLVQSQARRAWSHDGSSGHRTSTATRADLRKRLTSQRNARSRDGSRPNAAYQYKNVRLMKQVINTMDAPHISEEGSGTAE